MDSQTRDKGTFRGKTYTLFGKSRDAGRYYTLIRQLTDRFLARCPDPQRLLDQVRNAAKGRRFMRKPPGGDVDASLIPFIRKTIKESLSAYTTGVRQHLKTLPLSQRLDPILRTKEEQYHLYMIEIELVNRMFREDFRQSSYKFALIAHCLRDFRPGCKAEPAEYESVCRGCTSDCLVHLGSVLLKKYHIQPFISVTMDLDKLFRRIKAEYTTVGALGIACVPELAMGMRLCIETGISPLGIPLDANRCARWMKKAHETSFDLTELERLLT